MIHCVLLRRGGRGGSDKERHTVIYLQVNQPEYISDYGAISCPFKLLSPVVSKWRGEQVGREDRIKCLTLTKGGGHLPCLVGEGAQTENHRPFFRFLWNVTEAFLHRKT